MMIMSDVRFTNDNLPNSRAADVVAGQTIRSGTSVGANDRAACRAKSSRDMINKMKIVEEETDEIQYWLEILAMTVASIKTLRNRKLEIEISSQTLCHP